MATTGAAVSATRLTSPYVGLSVFTEDDAAIFFGREPERAVLISNLRAARLTLLYAQSGTGKSSLLRAGVASRLKELAQRSFDERGTARNIPIVFSSWRDEPADELIAQIGQQITRFRQPASPAWRAPERLEEALEQASQAADATLLVILDQFEEYFLYRSREARDCRFADELASCINRGDLRANFLISIREDAYSGLGDLFKSRIDNVYGNYLRLENLTADSARQAIEKPIASYNHVHREQQPVEIEPALVDAVVGQLRSGRFALDQTATGRLEGPDGAAPCRDEIAAPYLQLVMQRLWETETGLGSRKLRLATLEQLGGAQTIVWTHLDRALSGLPSQEREAAADIFHYLVTPSGTKIALTAADLAEYTNRPVSLATALLEHLASAPNRILRPVAPPPGSDGGVRYEISHDLLAHAILDWGGRHKAARLEQEKEAAERRVLIEKRRARNFRTLAGALALLVVVAAAILIPLVVLRPNVVSVYSGDSYGFNHPLAIAVDGTHIWVANYGGDSVTELNASNGSRVRTLYGFNEPGRIAVDGTHIWVPNLGGDSVTELNASDGSRVRTLSGGSYGFNGPWAIAVDSTHIWVANQGDSVTELNASGGSWVRTLSGGSYGFNRPTAIAVDGTHVWVANNNGNSVTELNASDGSWVQTLFGGSYGFNGPWAMAADGTHVWVANNDGNSVTELNASDGSWVQNPVRRQLRLQRPICDRRGRHPCLGRQR